MRFVASAPRHDLVSIPPLACVVAGEARRARFWSTAMHKENTQTLIRPSENEWVEISIELGVHLQDAVANFLMELGANGVVTDDEIIDPLTGKVPPNRAGCKRLSSYLKNNNQLSRALSALDNYLSSLAALHGLTDLPRMKLTIIREEDWNKKWQKFFSTCRIGSRIIIKPSWEIYLPKDKDIVIEMDPGMAFGTGTHPTTRMCLEVIEELAGGHAIPITTMLDVGMGSGILSIAAAKLGIQKVVGIDIDPIALRYARQNAEKNKVAPQVEVRECLLHKVEERFDLIVANILSEILIKLRKELLQHLGEHGMLVLSGILAEKTLKLEKAFSSKRLSLIDSRTHGEWACIVLQKQLA